MSRELAVLHTTLACNEYRLGADRLRLPGDRIPQLDEVTASLEPLTGFRYVPAAGLVPLREFYGSLADCALLLDAVHPAPLGAAVHAGAGRHPRGGRARELSGQRPVRGLYRAAGGAARRVESPEALEFVSKVFWFSLEFGVLREDGVVRTYGAGLLSSYGEIQEIAHADLRPLDIARMGVQTYDITHYQPLLFCAESFDHVEDVVGQLLRDGGRRDGRPAHRPRDDRLTPRFSTPTSRGWAGRSAAAALLGCLRDLGEQVRDRQVEPVREPPHPVQTRRERTRLDPADALAVEAAPLGEVLLAQAQLGPALAHHLAEAHTALVHAVGTLRRHRGRVSVGPRQVRTSAGTFAGLPEAAQVGGARSRAATASTRPREMM